MTVQFNVSRAEFTIIDQIVDRILDNPGFRRWGRTRQDWQMDIAAVHCNGCPLRLEDLLNAEPFDFAHDIAGIGNKLDRETGQLRDCFVPRFARPKRSRTVPSTPSTVQGPSS